MIKVKPRVSSPCRECKSRYIGCHDECVDYAKYKHKKEEIHNALIRGKYQQCEVDNYKLKSSIKTIKKKKGKKTWL